MESPITIPVLAGATSGLCGDGGVVGSRSRDPRSRGWRYLGRSRYRGAHRGGAGCPNHGLPKDGNPSRHIAHRPVPTELTQQGGGPLLDIANAWLWGRDLGSSSMSPGYASATSTCK